MNVTNPHAAEAVSAEAMSRIRQLFGPHLAGKIEAYASTAPYPNATVELLAAVHEDLRIGGTLPYYLGILLDAFCHPLLDESVRKKAISGFITWVSEGIAKDAEDL